ncbi:MAG: AI-2E family transporter [Proteobacteria bacterium]|nr:AI-2E family transporter [Pseudomonadota bacterium]MBU1716648.1 AI-2E family transporter [Pseudomonadota bacterium]
MVFAYFLVLFVIAILLMGRLLWPFLSIVVLSFMLTGIFQPVYALINKKFSPSFSSLGTCVLIIILVFVPLIFFIGALSNEAFDLYQLAKGANLNLKLKHLLYESALMARLQDILAGFGISLEPESISQSLSDFAKQVGLFVFNQASGWAANLMHFVFNFFMMIITIYFLLIDHERLVAFLVRLSPLPDYQERQLIKKFKDIAGAVLIGNGICGIIQGGLGALAFIFFNLGSPLLWGGIMAILAFLPIFGIGLVLIPAAIILFLQGNVTSSIIMIIFYASLSFSVEYMLKPKLVGRQVKMHTLVVFLAIMGGLSLYGVLGIIYGPLIVTGFLALAEIYMTNYNQLVTGEDYNP